MTQPLISKFNKSQRLKSAYSDTGLIQNLLNDSSLPNELVHWLTRLYLLKGVPFNYLVADEAMIPPESIRFFYLDNNWSDALIDGAFSIGRNLSDWEQSSSEWLQDQVTRQALQKMISGKLQSVNINSPAPSDTSPTGNAMETSIISGFLLNSSVVSEYPRLGVNAYPQGSTPNDPDPQLLPVLRLERLGAKSNTMLCLILGDAYQIDIHEPAETLHFGIDCFNDSCMVGNNAVDAVKNLKTFTIASTTQNGTTTNKVSLTGTIVDMDISSCFRDISSRVVDMTSLATTILTNNNQTPPVAPQTLPTSINSAEMGFVMTEGVGMVSFIKDVS